MDGSWGMVLFGPRHFGGLVVFGETVEITVEFLHALFVRLLCFILDPLRVLQE